MLNLTNTIVNTLNQSKLNLIEETRTMYAMHRDKYGLLFGCHENEQCDYIFINTDNYAKLMRPLDSNKNVQIVCSKNSPTVFAIMVPLWKGEVGQSAIDFILGIGDDVNRKANFIPPIPYSIWANDVDVFASIGMNTYPCATNLDEILSVIAATDECAAMARNYLEQYI